MSSKKRRRPQAPKQPVTGTPKGIQYLALKGMSYTPSTRDDNRRDRKQARQSLRKGDW